MSKQLIPIKLKLRNVLIATKTNGDIIIIRGIYEYSQEAKELEHELNDDINISSFYYLSKYKAIVTNMDNIFNDSTSYFEEIDKQLYYNAAVIAMELADKQSKASNDRENDKISSMLYCCSKIR